MESRTGHANIMMFPNLLLLLGLLWETSSFVHKHHHICMSRTAFHNNGTYKAHPFDFINHIYPWHTSSVHDEIDCRCKLSVNSAFGTVLSAGAFHALLLIAWLADLDSLMCCIVMMERQIAKMFSTFSL